MKTFGKICILIGIILILIGCRASTDIPTITNGQVETKIEYRDRIVHDSVLITEKIYQKEKGDTIFEVHEKIQFVLREKVDSFYLVNTDSIYIEKPIYIEKNLSVMQQVKIKSFWFLLMFFITIVAYMIYRMTR